MRLAFKTRHYGTTDQLESLHTLITFYGIFSPNYSLTSYFSNHTFRINLYTCLDLLCLSGMTFIFRLGYRQIIYSDNWSNGFNVLLWCLSHLTKDDQLTFSLTNYLLAWINSCKSALMYSYTVHHPIFFGNPNSHFLLFCSLCSKAVQTRQRSLQVNTLGWCLLLVLEKKTKGSFCH